MAIGGLLGLMLAPMVMARKEKQRQEEYERQLMTNMLSDVVKSGRHEVFDIPDMRKYISGFSKRMTGQDFTDQLQWMARAHRAAIEQDAVHQLLQGALPNQTSPTSREPSGITPGTGMMSPETLAGVGLMPPEFQQTKTKPQRPSTAPIPDEPTKTGQAPQLPDLFAQEQEPTPDISPVPPPSIAFSRRLAIPRGFSIESKSPATGATLKATGPTSAEEIAEAKLPGELTEQQLKIQGLQRLATMDKIERDARVTIAGHIAKSVEHTTLADKATEYERALAVAAGAGLKDSETMIKGRLDSIQEQIRTTTTPPDLSKPDVAKAVASTGVHPVTGMPVPQELRDRAEKIVKDEETRKLAQNRSIAEAHNEINLRALPTKVAITGAMRNLTKQGEAANTFIQRTEQVEGALKLMEKNLDVYPDTIAGTIPAKVSKVIQDDRGRVIAQIQQAINILQSAEARFMAGEVGRIPNQLEQQWRSTLADPTKVTRKTAEALIKTTRERLGDMARAKEKALERQGKAASSVGVPRAIVDAFTKGDVDALRLTQDEALKEGTLPPVLVPGDLGRGQQVR